MKVLFGISNEKLVANIVKYYEENYKEKIEYKIVYYFGQFRQEIINGDYDRAVLREDLEPLNTKSYAELDKQIFEYIDGITNTFEARNLILICSERRNIGDSFLARLFSIGVYTTLTGTNRTKSKLAEAIHSPTTKKEARKAYDKNTNANDVYNSSEVSELEIKRIIIYYQNQNGNTEKYNTIFDSVVKQYTTEQMMVIIKYLPKDVRDYLEKNSEAYKSILDAEKMASDLQKEKDQKRAEEQAAEVAAAQAAQATAEANAAKAKAEAEAAKANSQKAAIEAKDAKRAEKAQTQQPKIITTKNQSTPNNFEIKKDDDLIKKIVVNETPKEEKPVVPVSKDDEDAPIQGIKIQEQKPAQTQAPSQTSTKAQPEQPKKVEKEVVKEVPQEPKVIVKEKEVVKEVPTIVTQYVEKEVVKQYYDVPKDYRKTVCFVGAPKTGTTFCINAIGTFLAKKKVKTAIVDMTRKRDSYTIYTYDNTGKRNIAGQSLRYASSGKNEPLIYDKLSIYTAVPGEDRKSYNPNVLVDTIIKNNNVVLIDADFSTPIDYFRRAQDIYVVQDMNVLNIQQITMFLKELKQRGIGMEKIKIVINKYVDCELTSKDIIDGIATYTSYDLKMFDELFNPKKIQYFILPFDVANYKKYVEMVYKYSNKFSTFTKEFQTNLDQIINSIYPTKGLVSVQEKRYTQEEAKKSGGFGLFKKK